VVDPLRCFPGEMPMLQWLWFFTLALVANAAILGVQFWQVKHAANLILFGYHFSSVWTFWLAFSAVMVVVYFPINYLFFYLYWYGYHVVFPGRAWHVQESVWLAALVVTFFVGWLYLGELPAKNAIVAVFFLACALIAIVWK